MNTTKRINSPFKCPNGQSPKKQKLIDAFISVSREIACDKKSSDEIDKEQKENYDFLFDESADFDFDVLKSVEASTKEIPKLELSTWQRCVVVELERERKTFDLVLTVTSDQSLNKENSEQTQQVAVAKCHLQGPWCNTVVEVGNIVSLIAVWDDSLGAYKINKDDGFCVTNPDTLISGTTVVGSLFCRRKAVLQDRFKGIDANNKVMVIGSLVHELLQFVLEKGLKTYKDVDAVCQQLLQTQATAYTLYASLLTREETTLEVEKFVPNIVSFVEQYMIGKEPAVLQKDVFQGCINQIQDIEENLWIPQLGLKGKVDVSVRIQRRKNRLKLETVNNNAIPLELKTGRASFSMEHKGQLILYQMMLTAAGRNTHSGLLLYLREGIMREITGARNEQRDLIVLRNDLGHYLSCAPNVPLPNAALNISEGKFVQPMELPAPISHHSACSSCAYSTLCCAFAQTDVNTKLSDSHPLLKVMKAVTAHLKPADYAYFIKWCGLLSLEESEAKKTNYARALWTDKPEVRQQNGRALIDLELQTAVTLEEARYLHTFQLKSEMFNQMDITLSGFSCGEYVIVSTSKRLAIAAGCVYDINSTTISISLERNLHKNYSGQNFIIDKHESQTGNVFNFTNLGLMLDDTERAAALRDIVVHKKQPTYAKLLPKIIAQEGKEILKQLNSVQRSAVLKALTTESFMLIKGLPGTGKTQTLVAIVQLLYLMGKSIIITSHTHSAVDNLMIRLKAKDLPMLRLGTGERINPQLREYSETALLKDCQTEHALAQKYASYNIVGVTCLGAAHAIFLHRQFDYCIVDEATQVMQCTVLRPLMFCSKFILVGDPDQLPPLIRSKEARLRGADVSLFQRLDTEQATAVLTLQYRMNKTITKLANELTYNGALECASKTVQLAAFNFKAPSTINIQKWLQRVLQTHVDQSVFLLDTLNCAERSYEFASTRHSHTCAAIEQTFAADAELTTSPRSHKVQRRRISKYTNYCDAAIIFYIVEILLSAGYDAARIGIIAPYRAQVELLRKLAAEYHKYYQIENTNLNFSAVEVNTVDQYQGRDKDIILYSCAKTGSVSANDLERSREAEILADKRRLTVAITRSKHKLIIVGDAACLQQFTPFRALLEHIPSYCKLKLENDKLGFNWQQLLDKLSLVISN